MHDESSKVSGLLTTHTSSITSRRDTLLLAKTSIEAVLFLILYQYAIQYRTLFIYLCTNKVHLRN